jgi:hypothetical protein
VTEPRLLPLVRRWWWLLALGAVAAAGVAWVMTARAPKTYEADVKLLVGPVSGDYPTLQAAGLIGRTYAELAQSEPIVTAAVSAAGTGNKAGEISASSNDVTRIVDVRARHPKPALAARMADTVAAQLIRLRRRVPVQETKQVNAVMHDPALAQLTHAQRRGVRQAVERAGWKSAAGDLRVVDGPVAPRHPVARQAALFALLAGLGGALIALLFAAVREGLAGDSVEPFEDAEPGSFLPSPNGEGDASTAVERWLEEERTKELS